MNLQQDIELLKFYGCGDEAYELFRATCSLCYQMYGLGSEDRAEILYQWAKEMAEESYKYHVEERPDEMDDMETGHWGY